MNLSIDSNMAKEIMTRFIEQHHTIIEIEDAILNDDIWTVIALLSSPNDNIRKVRIDGNTGKIIDWSR
jgi:hypothetical protein